MKNDRSLADLLEALDRELEDQARSSLTSFDATPTIRGPLARAAVPLNKLQAGICVRRGPEASAPAR